MDDDDHDDCGTGNRFLSEPHERRLSIGSFEPRCMYYQTARGDLRCIRPHLVLMLRYNFSYPVQGPEDPDDPEPRRAYAHHHLGRPHHRT